LPEDEKKEVTVEGIKTTNEFRSPKRLRKKKIDTTPISHQEAELDLQQMGEETARKPVAQPQPKSERPMTLVLKDKYTYYGTREIWEKLFAALNMTKGKIIVKNIGISEDTDGVHAELDIEPVPEEKLAT